MRRALLLSVAVLLGFSAPLLAQDKEKEKAKKDDSLLTVKKVTVKQPALRITRPNDSWQFFNMVRLKAMNMKNGKLPDHIAKLKALLWMGTYKSRIMISAFVDGEPRKKEPTALELTQQDLKLLRPKFLVPTVSKIKGVKIGRRAGAWFELVGQARGEKKDYCFMVAIAYRAKDKAILKFVLQAPTKDKKKVKLLRKDFKKLLKKARF